MQKLFSSLRVMIAASAVALTACDTPVGPDEHEDEVVGAEVEDLDGNVIAAFDDESKVWTFASGDALQLATGEELAVRIFFIAEDGDRFQLPHSGAEYTLQVVIANTAIVTYSAHGDHGDFSGVAEGATTAEIQVFHGSHPDWRTNPALPIVVMDPTAL